MNLEGRTVLMVVAPEDFRDEEYFEPKAILEGYGAEVTTASTLPEAVSKQGKKINTDIQLGEIFDAEHDALVFVGGSGAEIYVSMVKAHTIAGQYLEDGKIVAAICLAPSILASAGLLEGKKATCHGDEIPLLEKHGAEVSDEAVVRDGNIITGINHTASQAFGEAIAEALAE